MLVRLAGLEPDALDPAEALAELRALRDALVG